MDRLVLLAKVAVERGADAELQPFVVEVETERGAELVQRDDVAALGGRSLGLAGETAHGLLSA